MFVGVMGVTDYCHIQKLLDMEDFWPSSKLMAGVLIDENLLHRNNNPCQNRFPKKLEEIPEIFLRDDRVWNFVRCYLEKDHLAKKLSYLISIVGQDRMDGTILPAWPPIEELIKIKHKYPDIKLFLSCPRETEDCMNDFDVVTKRLEEYIKTGALEGVILECNFYNIPEEVDALYVRDCLDYLLTHHQNLYIGVEGARIPKEASKLKPALSSSSENIGVILEEGIRTPSGDFLEFNSTGRMIKEVMAS